MKTRTKRNSNKKTLATAGLVALAAVSVFSVGFASWVIGSETTASTDQFTVNVESVSDSRVQLTAAMTTDNSITLGAKPSNTAGLITSNGTAVEDLTFSFTIYATCEDFTTNFLGLGFYYSDGKTGDEDPKISTYLTAEATKNNIVWPGAYTGGTYIPLVSSDWKEEGDYYAVYNGTTVLKVAKSGETEPDCSWKVNVDLSGDNKSATFTVTCYVKWGTAFQGMNPVLDEDMTSPNIEDIKAAIQTFAQINGATNVINIKHPTTPITIEQ